jgi:hypothetical protein
MFQAWKSGYAYYTVMANFTFNDFQQITTYCSYGNPSLSGSTSIMTGDAMYDDSTGQGVGSQFQGSSAGSSLAVTNTCNIAPSSQDASIHYSAVFTTTTTINKGDWLIPRGSVWANVESTAYYSQGGADHVYSALDFNNDGYGYITLNSIWVY